MMRLTDLLPELLRDEIANYLSLSDAFCLFGVSSFFTQFYDDLEYWRRRISKLRYRDVQESLIGEFRKASTRGDGARILSFFGRLLPTILPLLDRRTVEIVKIVLIRAKQYNLALRIDQSGASYYADWGCSNLEAMKRLNDHFDATIVAIRSLQRVSWIIMKYHELLSLKIPRNDVTDLLLVELTDGDIIELYQKYDYQHVDDSIKLPNTILHIDLCAALTRNGRLKTTMTKLTPHQRYLYSIDLEGSCVSYGYVYRRLSWYYSQRHNIVTSSDRSDLPKHTLTLATLTPEEMATIVKQSKDDHRKLLLSDRYLINLIDYAQLLGYTRWRENLERLLSM